MSQSMHDAHLEFDSNGVPYCPLDECCFCETCGCWSLLSISDEEDGE